MMIEEVTTATTLIVLNSTCHLSGLAAGAEVGILRVLGIGLNIQDVGNH